MVISHARTARAAMNTASFADIHFDDEPPRLKAGIKCKTRLRTQPAKACFVTQLGFLWILWVPTMNDQPLFQDSSVIVTSSMLVHGNQHYPLPSIKSVVFFKEPLDVKGLVINAVIALVGLGGILTFRSVCAIIGLIALGICGFNLYHAYVDFTNPEYVVAVEFHTGESIYI